MHLGNTGQSDDVLSSWTVNGAFSSIDYWPCIFLYLLPGILGYQL